MSLNSAINIKRNQQATRNRKAGSTSRDSLRTKLLKPNLNSWSEKKCKTMFRFTMGEIQRICTAMKLTTHQKFNDLRVQSDFAMAMLCYRYAFPQRLCEMVEIFGMSESNISRVLSGMSRIVYEKFERGIEFDERQFSERNLERFSRAIHEKGALIRNVVGFIDGTMIQTCRPTNSNTQRVVYNGWKHMHCLKYQAISTPDGITSSLYGPFVGSTNDPGMFNKIDTLQRISEHLERVSPDKVYAIYGDEAYTLSEHVIRPYSKPFSEDIEQEFNTSLSKVRVAVEMEFGKVAQFFGDTKWKYGNRIHQTRPALKYIISTILKNFHTILNGSSVTAIFKLDPPGLEEYINGLMREHNEHDLLE